MISQSRAPAPRLGAQTDVKAVSVPGSATGGLVRVDTLHRGFGGGWTSGWPRELWPR